MKFELGKYNIDKVMKALEDVQGKTVSINDTLLHGVISIQIGESEMYDADPEPEIGYDGGKQDLIELTFNFENGKAFHTFCPDAEVCEIIFETEDLWIINIRDLKQHLKNEIFDLRFRLEEYEKYMSK